MNLRYGTVVTSTTYPSHDPSDERIMLVRRSGEGSKPWEGAPKWLGLLLTEDTPEHLYAPDEDGFVVLAFPLEHAWQEVTE